MKRSIIAASLRGRRTINQQHHIPGDYGALRERAQRLLSSTVKPLAIVATVGMFLVLVMGATVTNTGSQTGCGPSWPLCRGRFIPQFAVSTAIEFSHRAIVGVESVLIIALAVVAWFLYHQRREIKLLVPTMVLFLFLQAGLGAWAVMAPQSAWVLAFHFGVSLIAFASVLLTTSTLFEFGNIEALREHVLPSSFRTLVLGTTLFSYLVVYLGAYVRHTDADEACSGWPLCNGAVIPNFHGLVGIAFAHRLAALLLTILIAVLVIWAVRLRHVRPDVCWASIAALALVLLQAVSGAVVVFTKVDLFSALVHAGLVALLFGNLTYLCLHLLPPSRSALQQRDAHSLPLQERKKPEDVKARATT
jgi:cytochrome c oxidase assembly protein subunit 15